MRLWRIVRGRPRLILAALGGLASYPLWPDGLPARTHALLAWDVGCLLFLILSAALFSSERHMAQDAAAQEEGEWTVFWIVVGAVVASFAAIVGEFSGGDSATPSMRGLRIALVAATLLLSWLATHTMFAMRYAHEYYGEPESGGIEEGLKFPGDEKPDYWDFFYFSLVLGMTFQVSDVEITSRKLRRLATAHGLLSFLFNTVIVALMVNIAASLLGK